MAKPRKPSQEKVGLESISQPNTKAIVLSVVGVVAVLALVAVGFVLSNNDSDDPASGDVLEFRPIKLTGDPLPAEYADADQKQLVEATGVQAPDIIGSTFDGTSSTLTKDGRGKAVVFLAHWCPHCQKELPLISDWLKSNKSKYPNVDFYAVATGSNANRPNYPPSKWFSKEGWSGKVIVDDNSFTAGNNYGLGSYPYLVFLDGQNKVVTRTSGELPISDFANLVQRTQDAATANGATTTTAPTSSTTAAPQSPVGQ